MSEARHTTPETETPPPNAIETFLLKVGIVTAAAVLFFYATAYIVDSFVSSRLKSLEALKGGKSFWGSFENKLYELADAPDIDPERKARILAALAKISHKYRPYLEAAGMASPPPH